jgi:hypothetical protein
VVRLNIRKRIIGSKINSSSRVLQLEEFISKGISQQDLYTTSVSVQKLIEIVDLVRFGRKTKLGLSGSVA